MANENHLKLIQQDVEDWNDWRLENSTIKPDLSRADLSAYRLGEINLKDANLEETSFGNAYLFYADLSNANLKGANLSGADLGLANLSQADLTEANFMMANLTGATLINANLHKAFLVATNLTSARLTNADFTEARISGTVFGFNDLGEVKGLDAASHIGPSEIGVSTLLLSKGKIPESFLRGTGIPDTFIAYLNSPAGIATKFHSCFISYSTIDQEFARRLHGDLQKNEVPCWYAPDDLKIGDKFQERIDESISHHNKLLLILSQHSCSSGWVEREVKSATDREQRENRLVLFPIRIDNAVMTSSEAWVSLIRKTRHIGDFTQWGQPESYEAALKRLLRDLKENP